MKCLRFLPLAFVAGIDGFHLFAPYAALVLVAVPLLARIRQRLGASNRSDLLARLRAELAVGS